VLDELGLDAVLEAVGTEVHDGASLGPDVLEPPVVRPAVGVLYATSRAGLASAQSNALKILVVISDLGLCHYEKNSSKFWSSGLSLEPVIS